MSGSDCTDLSHCECVDRLYERVDDLEQRLIDSRTRANDLKRWIAGIADDKQMPTYVQQSARSLLAQEGECVDSLYERIKLLEKRVIDLQGHDDLGYIDKKLSEYSKVLYQIKPTDRGDYILESVVPTTFGGDAVNYVFRGLLEDCERVRDELIKEGK
jgi:hypothetical protein